MQEIGGFVKKFFSRILLFASSWLNRVNVFHVRLLLVIWNQSKQLVYLYVDLSMLTSQNGSVVFMKGNFKIL